MCGKRLLNLQDPCRDVNLSRAPAGIIGDRVRLFELFAAQKERAVVEESSRVNDVAIMLVSCASKAHTDGCLQIQCQMWLDNILRDLIESKRLADDQAKYECHGLIGACFRF